MLCFGNHEVMTGEGQLLWLALGADKQRAVNSIKALLTEASSIHAGTFSTAIIVADHMDISEVLTAWASMHPGATGRVQGGKGEFQGSFRESLGNEGGRGRVNHSLADFGLSVTHPPSTAVVRAVVGGKPLFLPLLLREVIALPHFPSLTVQ